MKLPPARPLPRLPPYHAAGSGCDFCGAAPDSGTQFNIGEEFGTAKRNLPPPELLSSAS